MYIEQLLKLHELEIKTELMIFVNILCLGAPIV